MIHAPPPRSPAILSSNSIIYINISQFDIYSKKYLVRWHLSWSFKLYKTVPPWTKFVATVVDQTFGL